MIISSGQPSLNPRLVKEADALADAGYKVTVLYAYWNSWGTQYDRQLLPQKKWQAIRVGGDPEQARALYFISRLINKTATLLYQKFKIKQFAEAAIARSSFFLMRDAPKYKADFYLAHNLGALPAVVKAAKSNKKPCGFDAEDFHRFEASDDINDNGVILKTFVEDKYIPKINYLSAASPLIAEAYNKLYPGKHPVTLLNVFPLDAAVSTPVINRAGPVKLFWFSQTIGANRGIDTIIKALQLLSSDNFELHLLGFIPPGEKAQFIANLQIYDVKLYLHEPVPPDKLIDFASQFDIGLAMENSIPVNRDICLTNKIFTYMQAGLAIAASDTSAQVKLMGEYPTAGKVYRQGDAEMLAGLLNAWHQSRNELLNARIESLRIGRTALNWESEAPKLLNAIKHTLKETTTG